MKEREELEEALNRAEAAEVERDKLAERVRRLEEMIRRMLLEHECKWYLPEEGDCFTNGEENPCVWCRARAALEEEKR